MDGDGEDQPQEVIKMLRLSRKYKNYVITSNRKKREESFLIRSLYNLHLILTFYSHLNGCLLETLQLFTPVILIKS